MFTVHTCTWGERQSFGNRFCFCGFQLRRVTDTSARIVDVMNAWTMNMNLTVAGGRQSFFHCLPFQMWMYSRLDNRKCNRWDCLRLAKSSHMHSLEPKTPRFSMENQSESIDRNKRLLLFIFLWSKRQLNESKLNDLFLWSSKTCAHTESITPFQIT